MCDCDRSIWALMENDVLGFYCLGKTLTESNWEGKSFFHLNVYSQSSKDVSEQVFKVGTWRQEPKKKPWTSVTYWLAPMACSTMFSTQPRTTSSGWLHPQWLDCPCPSLIQKMPHRLSHVPIRWRFFSIEVLFSQMSLACVRLRKKKKNNCPAHYTRGSLPIQLDMGRLYLAQVRM